MKHRPAREEELLNDSDAYKALLREELRLLQSLARCDRSIAEEMQREDLMSLSVYELERLRKIEEAARAVCEAIPAWAEELLEIHPLAPLRKLVETNDD